MIGRKKEMKKYELRKGLVIGIIILFLGASVVSGFKINEKNNDRDILTLSDRDILTLRPNGPGYTTQLSAHGDSPNWKCIDEVDNHDEFATYVANDHTGQDPYEFYNFENTNENGIINKISTYTYCNHDGGGPGYNWIKHGLYIDGSTYYPEEHTEVNPGWQLDILDWDINPNTELPWTWDDINDLQAGLQMYQNAANQATYMTQMWIVVDYTHVNTAFLFGRIENLNTEGDLTTFDAVKLRYIQFSPFSFNTYASGEEIAVVGSGLGIVTTSFAFGFFSAAVL